MHFRHSYVTSSGLKIVAAKYSTIPVPVQDRAIGRLREAACEQIPRCPAVHSHLPMMHRHGDTGATDQPGHMTCTRNHKINYTKQISFVLFCLHGGVKRFQK